jgi:hypothetical protein
MVALCSRLAGEVKLGEHPDFDQFVVRTAAQLEIPEPFVEKDYYLSEALRVVAAARGDRVIFKGGTSLSKCWRLVRRFSEDIDLYLRPTVPPQSEGQVDSDLRRLKDAVATGVPALQHESRRVNGGRSRLDVFRYEPRFALPGGLPSTIQLEPGIQGGHLPNEPKQVTSYVAEALTAENADVEADDLGSFEIHVLHFSRTFIEKLFAVHGLVVRLEQQGTPLGRDARHYHDLHALAARAEVIDLLGSDECDAIRVDVDRVCQTFYSDRYVAPHRLRLADSPAILPPRGLRAQMEDDYNRECARLCYDGDYATFDAVLSRLQGLGALL